MDEKWIENKIRGLERQIAVLEKRIRDLERDHLVYAVGKFPTPFAERTM